MTLINKCLAIALCLISSAALGLNSDTNEKLFISAQTSSLNFKTGIHVYRGNVKATQGSTLLTGETVTTKTNSTSRLVELFVYAKPNVEPTPENLAHYQTIPKADEEPVDARAEIIYYYPKLKKVVLLGHANVIQGLNNYKGEKLTYYIKRQQVFTEDAEQHARAHFTIDTSTL